MTELIISQVCSEEGSEDFKLKHEEETGFLSEDRNPASEQMSEHSSNGETKEPSTELTLVSSQNPGTPFEPSGEISVLPKRSSSRANKGKKADFYTPDEVLQADRKQKYSKKYRSKTYRKELERRKRQGNGMLKDTGQENTIREPNFKVTELIEEKNITFLCLDSTTDTSKSKFEHEESVLNEARENLLKAVDSIDLCETQLISLQEVYADSVKTSALCQLQSVKVTLGNILHELNSNRQQKRIKLEMMYEQEIEDRWDTVEVKSEIWESNEENVFSDLGPALTTEDFPGPEDDGDSQENLTGRPRRKSGRPRKYNNEDEDFCQVVGDTSTQETVTKRQVKSELKDKDFDLRKERKETWKKVRKASAAETVPGLPCPHCDKVIKTPHWLARHIENMHASSYPCDQCDQVFETKHERYLHRKHHSRTICPICGANVVASRLLSHMRYHDEKKYKCDECGKKYHTKFKLKEHKRSHTGEKPFKCEECGKGFSGLRHLQRHRFIHTGEKPYKCDQCHMAFNQKYNLTVHKKSHIRGTIKADPPVKDDCDDDQVENGDTGE